MGKVIEFIYIFIIYSFIGWLIESAYKSIRQKKIVNSGFLMGPFCPIYGCGALIMYYALSSIEDNIGVLFLAGFIILSLWEYIVSLFLEIVFKAKYWDYSNYFLNINGRVCFMNSIFWGILGILFMKVINPFVSSIIGQIPVTVVVTVLGISLIYIIVDTIITTTNLIKVNINLEKIEKMEQDIRRKIQVYNNLKKHRDRMRIKRFEERVLFAKNMIDFRVAGSDKKDELIKFVEKRTKRIRKAFPSMKSDRLSKLLKKEKE